MAGGKDVILISEIHYDLDIEQLEKYIPIIKLIF
jgi:hypothetical protein